MMLTVQKAALEGRKFLKKLALDPRVHLYARALGYALGGFMLSAASLKHAPLPLAMGLVCGCTGWAAVLSGIGGALGYLFFWGTAGYQGIFWVLAGLAVALFPGNRRNIGDTPLLLPALTGLLISAGGVLFQTWLGDRTPVDIYLLRIALGSCSAWLFRQVLHSRNPILRWPCWGFVVLSLAQIAPLPTLSLGFVAAGAMGAAGAFPAVAIGGLALDLSGISPVSMTAVLCCSYLPRFLPRFPKWLGALFPAVSCLAVMQLCAAPAFEPLPGLLLGGILGTFLPAPIRMPSRRGETGVAQVRLEMVASVLAQTEQLLLEVPPVPVDEDALVARAAEQACGGCPCRKNCKDTRRLSQLPGAVLHKPLLSVEELPILCRKGSRLLAHLHRSQEQLRTIRADRERQQEYKSAVVQQYRFLSEYLQELSDGLARKGEAVTPVFIPRVHVYANRPKADNGDRCLMFTGTRGRYYVLLCDGMGTGIGAVQEGKTAAQLLRRLLTAGYPAQHALRSLNSLCALRSRAGIVTVELLEIALDTGKANLYKWGAAPSYLVSAYGAEKLGTAGPPPGLSVTEGRESAHQLSLRRGELLLLVSDGISQEEALQSCLRMAGASPGELAVHLLDRGQQGGEDDATVVTVYLDRKTPEQT